MTREDEIRARMEKATPGPWVSIGLRIYIDESRRYFEDEVCVANKIQDAQFIAKAPADIYYLLKENKGLSNWVDVWRTAAHTASESLDDARRKNEQLREAARHLHETVNTYHLGDCDKATVIKAQSALVNVLLAHETTTEKGE